MNNSKRFIDLINKKIYLVFIFLIYFSVNLLSQVDELKQFEEEFESFKNEMNTNFSSFKDSVDLEYARFIEANWNSFALQTAATMPIEPSKPQQQPLSSPEQNIDDFIFPLSKINLDQGSQAEQEGQIIEFEEKAKENLSSSLRTIRFDYFGLELNAKYDQQTDFKLEDDLSKSIPSAWTKLSQSNYYSTMNDIVTSAKNANLNDWGLVILFKRFSEKVFTTKNEQLLFISFALTKTGFNAKVGYSDNELYLLVPSSNEIYDVPYLTIDEIRFYVFDFNSKKNKKIKSSIKSYSGQYQRSTRMLNFLFPGIPDLKSKIATKTVSFKHLEKEYSFKVKYDQALTNFYHSMPIVEFKVYFSTPLSEECMASIRQGLEPILKGKSETEIANILLSFVQTGFAYQTDQEQFGSEKYFYPEEVFYYPFADCEDRSALYAVLVKEMLGLDVIGLLFTNHVATAVKFNKSLKGDHVLYDEKKYIICDPTYIGAKLGMCMAKYINSQTEIFTF